MAYLKSRVESLSKTTDVEVRHYIWYFSGKGEVKVKVKANIGLGGCGNTQMLGWCGERVRKWK